MHLLLADLRFIWSVRTVKIARKILPEINEAYESLVKEWGEEYAREVLDVTIYITEKDRSEAASFRAQIRDFSLFKNRKVVFIRPKLGQIVEEYVVKLSKSRVNIMIMYAIDVDLFDIYVFLTKLFASPLAFVPLHLQSPPQYKSS